jgi:hypothetical protein
MIVYALGLRQSLDHYIAEHQDVHFGAQEAVERLARRADTLYDAG